MASTTAATIDPRSGFCSATGIFHSRRAPLVLPTAKELDIFSFVSTRPVHSATSNTTALVDATTGARLTYSDLWRSISAVAAHLSTTHNVGRGDVVLILSPNSIYFPVVALSVMSLGAVITTTNPLNTPSEITKQLSPSNPSVAFTTSPLLPKLQSFTDLPIVLLDEESPKVHDDPRIVSSISAMMDDKNSPPQKRQASYVGQDDTATLLYSSGTTGESKGVVSTHRNLVAMTQILSNRFMKEASKQPEVFICTVPMFHIYGLAAFAVGLLATGSTVVVLSKFEMGDLMSAIGTHRVTFLPLVPPVLVAMIQNAAGIKRRYDLGSLRNVLSGGAPLSKEVIEGFAREYPEVVIQQGYGLTESTGIGASTDTQEESRRYGTAGLLSPNTEAKIVVPETGTALPVNTSGELWFRGPFVMKGYFDNPEATKSTLLSEGWLRTGDLCYIDEDGFLFVVDRLKELIKYKGYQVPPAELESLLLTHPLVSDVAVVPYPDPEVGQYPMAFVVRKHDDHPSEGELMDFVARQVAPYKKVRRVAFVPAIPKNASGKILRKDLIGLAASKL